MYDSLETHFYCILITSKIRTFKPGLLVKIPHILTHRLAMFIPNCLLQTQKESDYFYAMNDYSIPLLLTVVPLITVVFRLTYMIIADVTVYWGLNQMHV